MRIFQNGLEIPLNKCAAIKYFFDACKKNWTPSAMVRSQDTGVIRVNWNKPQEGWVTLNVDGSCNNQIGSSGVGGVIQDHNGSWQVGFLQNIGKGHPLLAEAWTVLIGLQVVISKNFPNDNIESDSLDLVNFLQGKYIDESMHPLHNICYSILQLLKSIPHVQIKHIYRETIVVADFLAVSALLLMMV